MLGKRLAAGVALLVFGLTISDAGAATAPASPQASECTVAPIDINDLQSLVASGTPAAATPRATAALTAGDSDAIVKTIEQSVACTDANQPLRALALFTNRYLVARFSGKGADDLGHLAAAITRDPAPAQPSDRLVVLFIGAPKLLSDGRASVLVETANVLGSFTDVLILEKVGDVWLIDETHTATKRDSATPTT